MNQNLPHAWADVAARQETLSRAARQFNRDPSNLATKNQVRYLTREDAPLFYALSVRATQSTPFFSESYALTVSQMQRYWQALAGLAVRDPEALAIGLFHEERLVSLMLLATARFPRRLHTIRYLLRLLRSLGPRSFARYLRAAAAYRRILFLKPAERFTTLRVLWMYTEPTLKGTGYGTLLALFTGCLARDLGFRQGQALFNSRDERLRHFYGTYGWRFGREGFMSGHRVTEVTLPLVDEKPGGGGSS